MQPIIECIDGSLIIAGAADLGGLPAIERALRQFVDDGADRAVTIDIDGLAAVHDAVLGMVAGAVADITSRGGTARVICNRPSTIERLQLMGLEHVVSSAP